jgi:hypothetical protein
VDGSIVPPNSFAVHTTMDGYLASASTDPSLFWWRLQSNLTKVLYDMWCEKENAAHRRDIINALHRILQVRIIRLDWGLQPHSYWLIRALASRGTTPFLSVHNRLWAQCCAETSGGALHRFRAALPLAPPVTALPTAEAIAVWRRAAAN